MAEIDYSLLGKRLAEIRKRRKLTQEKLAEQTELANNYISNIENNRSIPSLETLMKLCNVLNISPNDILVGANVSSANYLTDELIEKLKRCTPRERRIVNGLLDLILSEQQSEEENF